MMEGAERTEQNARKFYFLKCVYFDSIAQNAYARYLWFSKE